MALVHEITLLAGARKRRKRVGRGESSGLGKTAGRGHKGLQSRSGGGTRRLTEGGQMPIFRRLPKRGFNNYNFRTEFEIVNLSTLNERFSDGDTVDLERLRAARLVQGADALVKILAKGALERKLTVEAHAFSKQARELIEKVGGQARLIERRTPQEAAKAKRNSVKFGDKRAAKRPKSSSARLAKKKAAAVAASASTKSTD